MMSFINFLTRLFVYLLFVVSARAEIYDESDLVLRGGWYWFEPYQYLAKAHDQKSLTGLDVQIAKKVFDNINIKLDISPLSWHEHVEQIKTGERDFAVGATFTEERSQFAYFSIPYRYEENAFFVHRSDEQNFKFSKISDLLNYIENNRFKVGVVEGFVYADKSINEWIKKESNKDLIELSKDDRESVKKLNDKMIRGFFSDRISGSTAIWHQGLGGEITEIKLGIKTPIHFMFSKKTINENVVQIINDSINQLLKGREIDYLVESYFYPVLLLQTVDTIWFRMFEIIGALAMAISGLVIAYRDRATIFGAFLLALLPSLGGSIVRDLVFDRFPVRAIGNPSNFIMVLCVVVVSFFFIRFIDHFQWQGLSSLKKQTWLIHILAISEALGLAAFTISGIVVSVVAKVNPLWLWGPFFALVTGTGGGILRDLIGKDRDIMALRGGLLPEVAVIWGLLLSLILVHQAHAVDTDFIKFSLIITAVGIFSTRVIIYVFKIPNIFLRKMKQ